MERKLATVLFVDLVDSTSLVAGTDPEVVRRRVNEFFETVSSCVAQHGGLVEKFAGDAVLAFGVPQAHEDDALRAIRAALAMRDSVVELGLQARVGIEAGELVVESAESTFATGEAVNLAARLSRSRGRGRSSSARRPTASLREASWPRTRGPRAQGDRRAAPRVAPRRRSRRPSRQLGPRAPLVGRVEELELLENTFERTIRDRRAHVFTIYGEPGVGKSRLAREFLDGSSASCLVGRALPYGEGVTYWPSRRWSGPRPASPTTTRSTRLSRSSASAAPRSRSPMSWRSRPG